MVTLDDLAREGAKRMIATALEAEVEDYVASFAEELDKDGRRLVVRNGRAEERRLTVDSDTVGIRTPRVNDERVDEDRARQRFGSWPIELGESPVASSPSRSPSAGREVAGREPVDNESKPIPAHLGLDAARTPRWGALHCRLAFSQAPEERRR